METKTYQQGKRSEGNPSKSSPSRTIVKLVFHIIVGEEPIKVFGYQMLISFTTEHWKPTTQLLNLQARHWNFVVFLGAYSKFKRAICKAWSKPLRKLTHRDREKCSHKIWKNYMLRSITFCSSFKNINKIVKHSKSLTRSHKENIQESADNELPQLCYSMLKIFII